MKTIVLVRIIYCSKVMKIVLKEVPSMLYEENMEDECLKD